MSKQGILPPRPGEEGISRVGIDESVENKEPIRVEFRGHEFHMSAVEALALSNKIATTVEIWMRVK